MVPYVTGKTKNLCQECNAEHDFGEGGNLLFHLDKLIKSGIIQQKGDRGEYRITCRGYEMAGAVAERYLKIG